MVCLKTKLKIELNKIDGCLYIKTSNTKGEPIMEAHFPFFAKQVAK
jgi:hypothetical protein